MNLLLVVRSEIICLVILFFILLYSKLYKMGKDQGNFSRICAFAIAHVIFDIITVITVNNLDTVPPHFNWLCHIVFYMTALLFSYEFFCYTVSLCYTKKALHIVRRLGLMPVLIFLAVVPFLPMVYLTGNGTNYSFGVAAITGYGVAMLLFVASIVVVLINIRKLERYVIGALLPMLFASIIAELIQIAIPELLFTGGAVTIITVGFFFSLENPVAVLRQKVLTDALTGVKSRHSYEENIVRMEREFSSNSVFGIVVCDINGLKAVNDNCGHMEGDSYIGCVAEILMSSLVHVEDIYRTGGDEFLAVYKDIKPEIIRNGIEAVERACAEQSKTRSYPVSIAIGYAVSDKTYKTLKDVLRTADYQMYTNKANTKRQYAYLFNNSKQLNISGLTDRIFEAFAGTDPNRFLFVCNMTTNVTRLSRSAVEYFGMGSEFIYDFNKKLIERIHPDDRDSYFDDVSAVFSGNQKYHDIEYRIRNSSDNYVVCSSNGTVLRGKNGEPDMFAGTMFIRSATESIDRLTDLRNGYEMMNYFNYLIRNNVPAAILKLGIMNLSRINMLYGYVCGNEILKQFASETRNIVGETGSVFRSDGTKLVVCIPNASRTDLMEIYRRIKLLSEQRIHIATVTQPLQLAAGAYMLPMNLDGTGSVIRSNLIYAYDRSKYDEHGRLVFYDSRSVAAGSSDHKGQLLKIHQDAIAGREGFYMVYQPIVYADTGKVVGAEALLRWSGNGTDIVRPGEFIPWLEEDPCFFGLGNWILRKALFDAGRILKYQPDFVININVAMTQLEHEGFKDALLQILKETQFPPEKLCLELTERCRELNINFLKEEIGFFRNHGIKVALDDLGTGFSSFGLLLSLNVDEIKLDHTFVKEIRTQRVNQILTKMLIDASKSMGYATCLEGVEDMELCNYLKDYGATYFQGYYCSAPARIDKFIGNMKKWNEEREKDKVAGKI